MHFHSTMYLHELEAKKAQRKFYILFYKVHMMSGDEQWTAKHLYGKCRGLLQCTVPQLIYTISKTHEPSQDNSNAAGININSLDCDAVQVNRQATVVSGVLFARIVRAAEGYPANCTGLYCKIHHKLLKCHADTKSTIVAFSVHLVNSGLS
jgi:hypothetical protein